MSVYDAGRREVDRMIAAAAEGADPGEWLATFVQEAGLTEYEAAVVIFVVTRLLSERGGR